MIGGGWLIWAIAAGVAWVLFACACRALLRNPRYGAIEAGLYFAAAVLYAKLVHRLRVHGRENIPPPIDPAQRTPGLMVVANHTGGIDPVLLQAALRNHEIRWMMAKDMMVPILSPLWEWMRIIAVVRSSDGSGPGGGLRGDAASAREALRHLKSGGVLGVFPEGGIERPPGRLRPFMPGVGLLAAHSGATVLPIAITGTPFSPDAWGSFVKPSRSTLTILPPVRYPARGMKPDEIVADLERRFMEATGWEMGEAEPG